MLDSDTMTYESKPTHKVINDNCPPSFDPTDFKNFWNKVKVWVIHVVYPETVNYKRRLTKKF